MMKCLWEIDLKKIKSLTYYNINTRIDRIFRRISIPNAIKNKKTVRQWDFLKI